MKAVALCGSPRREGNTAFLLRTLTERLLRRGHDAQYIHLPELRIEDCNGCLVCEETECTGHCTLTDDMQAVLLPQLLTADAIVLGTPSYFDLPTAQMKRFMDRSNMILKKLVDKRLVFALVVVGQSDVSSLAATCRALRRYCAICGMTESAGSPILVVARNEGDVRTDRIAISAVEQLAEALTCAGGIP